MYQEAENRQVFMACYEAARAGDLDTFKSHFDPKIELHEAASLPYGGVYNGPDAVIAALQRVFAAWGDVQFVLKEMVVGRDLGFVHFDVTFTAKNGSSVEMPVVEIWRIRNAKLTEIRPFYFDTHAAWEALAER